MYIGQFFGSLPSASYLVSFPHLAHPETLPWVCLHLSAKMDLQLKASGRSKTHYGLALSPDFRPPRNLSAYVQCLPCPQRKEWTSLNPLLKTGFCPSLSLHNYYLKMF